MIRLATRFRPTLNGYGVRYRPSAAVRTQSAGGGPGQDVVELLSQTHAVFHSPVLRTVQRFGLVIGAG